MGNERQHESYAHGTMMRCSVWSVVLLGFVAQRSPAAVWQPAGPNLLSNGGFERGMAEWSIAGEKAAVACDEAVVHAGKRSLRIAATGRAGEIRAIGFAMVDAAKKYRVTFAAKTSALGRDPRAVCVALRPRLRGLLRLQILVELGGQPLLEGPREHRPDRGTTPRWSRIATPAPKEAAALRHRLFADRAAYQGGLVHARRQAVRMPLGRCNGPAADARCTNRGELVLDPSYSRGHLPPCQSTRWKALACQLLEDLVGLVQEQVDRPVASDIQPLEPQKDFRKPTQAPERRGVAALVLQESERYAGQPDDLRGQGGITLLGSPAKSLRQAFLLLAIQLRSKSLQSRIRLQRGVVPTDAEAAAEDDGGTGFLNWSAVSMCP